MCVLFGGGGRREGGWVWVWGGVGWGEEVRGGGGGGTGQKRGWVGLGWGGQKIGGGGGGATVQVQQQGPVRHRGLHVWVKV